MQILHWSLSHPQTGNTLDRSPHTHSISSDERTLVPPNKSPARQYPYLTALLSPRKDSLLINSDRFIPKCPSKEEMNSLTDLDPPRAQPAREVFVTAGDGRRNNPEDDGNRQPGDHYKSTDKRVQKRKRGPSENEEMDQDDLLTDDNGYVFEHSHKAYLIVNLYGSPDRNGYTYTAYLPETPEQEARLFKESHLIPYSETHILDCINMEILPIRLLLKLETEDGIDLIRYRNCVICEVRDFRHYCKSSPNAKIHPICRKVVLKSSTQTLLHDLETLIQRSRISRKNMLRLNSQSGSTNSEDELLNFNRRRLRHPKYPFDRYDEDKSLIGLDGEVEDPDTLTLDQRHELEKRLVKETGNGLCLDPSKQVGLIANCAQFERFKWNSRELTNTLQAHHAKRMKLSLPSRIIANPLLLSNDEELEGIQLLPSENKMDAEVAAGEDEENTVPNAFSSVLLQEPRKTFRKNILPILSFVKRCAEQRKNSRKVIPDKSELLRLPPYSTTCITEAPTNLEQLKPLLHPSDPPTRRQPMTNEHFVTKNEEYVFETERRNHQHRTLVRIFQRNGTDSYFGELEQEAFNDDNSDVQGRGIGSFRGNTIPIKPFGLDTNAFSHFTGSSSKCQFELGPIQSVNRYLKQFRDIYTEEGRRPCKIILYRAGQGPTTVFSNSYKDGHYSGTNNTPSSISAAPPTATLQTSATVTPIISAEHVSPTVVISHNGSTVTPYTNSPNTIFVSVPSLPAQNALQAPSTISIPLVNSSTAPSTLVAGSSVLPIVPISSSASSQTNPPVQIVHPQPRPQPNAQTSATLVAFSQGLIPHLGGQTVATTTVTSLTPMTAIPVQRRTKPTPTNVNLNLNLNSARLLQQRHQILTRPIYNVNVNSQQQLTISRPVAGTIQPAPQLIQTQPQHHHQPGIRVKQPTLATLLLTGPTSAKPITVAIQPQPQNPGLASGQLNVQTIQFNSAALDGHHNHHLATQAQQVQISSHGHGASQANNPIMIMVSSATGNALAGQNTISIPGTATHHTIPHHAGNVNLNLNAINLEGLLAGSVNGLQHPAYVTSTALVNAAGTASAITTPVGLSQVGMGNHLNTLNIVRLSNNAGTVTLQPQHIVRQNAATIMSTPQQATMVNMNSTATPGILLNSSGSGTLGAPATVNSIPNPPRLQLQQNLRQNPPELEEISVPDLNALLGNGCGTNRLTTYTRSQPKVSSIDLNLNLNLNLSGASSTRNVESHNATSTELYTTLAQNGASQQIVNASSVDSIFNVLSEAIGLETKLEGSGISKSTTVHMGSPNLPQVKNSVLTLNDLLGTPPMSGSQGQATSMALNHHIVSSPIHSPQSPSTILSPISPSVVVASNVAYTTPRLSALLAGTPSADSSTGLLVDSTTGQTGIASANYGNLLDRLMSQGQIATASSRSGGSRLNPIATATPSVVLEHPVLAATLTASTTTNANLRQALTRPTAYRQIAPAPAPSSNVQSSNTTVISQQQQLINLLGFVGTANSAGQVNPNSGQGPQTIRISTTNNTSSSSGSGNLGNR